MHVEAYDIYCWLPSIQFHQQFIEHLPLHTLANTELCHFLNLLKWFTNCTCSNFALI